MKRMQLVSWGLLITTTPGFIGCASTSQSTAEKTKAPAVSVAADLASAREYEKQGYLAEAATAYRELLEQDPENSQYLHRLGVIETRLSRYDEAMECYKKALATDGENPTLLSDMGYTAYLAKDLEQAQTLLEKSLALRPDDQRATNNLAMVKCQAGDFEEGLALFRKVTTEQEALCSLASIHEERGENDLAVQRYSQALDVDGEFMPALESLTRLVRAHQEQVAAREKSQPATQAAGSESVAASQDVIKTVSAAPAADLSWAEEEMATQSSQVEQAGKQTFEAEPYFVTEETPVASLPVVTPQGPQPVLAVEVASEEVAFADSFTEETTAVASPFEETLVEVAPADQPVPAPVEPALPQVASPEPAEGLWQDLEFSGEEEQELTARTKLAGFKGYCPVALRDQRELVEAQQQYTVEFEGQKYEFSSEAAAATFSQAPKLYAPAAGGVDVVAVHSGEPVEDGSIDHGAWFRGRLYLFSSQARLDAFRLSPAQYVLE